MSNILEQNDEVAALSAIYEGSWTHDAVTSSYRMKVAPDVDLYVKLIKEYPSSKPPSYELSAPHVPTFMKQQIARDFKAIYEQHFGAPIIFQWISHLREILESVDSGNSTRCEHPTGQTGGETRVSPEILHGPIIQDRKSVFQGHCAIVNSVEQVRKVMDILMSNKKINQAKHNILAYRIKLPNGCISQDHDEDGEKQAGGRLIRMLEKMKLSDIMVVVTRWYGGIHLGPDRFRHINNAARQALAEAGFIT